MRRVNRTFVLAAALLVVVAPAALPAATAGPRDHAQPTDATTQPLPALDTARDQLDRQTTQLQDDHLLGLLDHQHRNIDTAEELLALLEDRDAQEGVDLATAVQLATIGTQHQALTLDLDPNAHVNVPSFNAPSQALETLAQRHGAHLSPEDRFQLARVDAHPAAEEITHVVEAFLALEDETANADVDLQRLEQLRQRADAEDAEVPADEGAIPQLQELGLDVAGALAARTHLLEAVLALDEALDETPMLASAASGPTLAVPPAFAIDLDGTNTTYTDDVALLLDTGGNDTYHNNAGGNNLVEGVCPDLPTPGVVGTSAALVDLGTGIDEYGDADSPRGCGANGGGARGGVGFLLDAGGHDTYTGDDVGVNGGGDLGGVGFLLDAGGSDTYTGDDLGVNGGGTFGGVGFLLDAAGNDNIYGSGLEAINGGGAFGVGFLLDAGGSDTYEGGVWGVNGGGRLGGVGFLLDAGGSDTYDGGSSGVNGGGRLGGVGFLLDAGGSDTYDGNNDGVNGGGDLGVGFLLDAAGGDDTYTASFNDADNGVNGGGGSNGGVGFLLDGGGTDTYEDGQGGTGTDKTVVPKGQVGAQIDWLPRPSDLIPGNDAMCPYPVGSDPVEACLVAGDVVDTYGAQANFTGPSHAVAGYVDRYAFDFPTGGTLHVPCVTTVVDGNELDPCREAGGTFQERVLTLVDQSQNEAEVASADTVEVCEGSLTVTAAGFGVSDAGVLTVC